MRQRAVVAIIGRPNVGKSTLFNRLINRLDAVVHDLPGVTRDRHYESITWNDCAFDVVDTGGLLPLASDDMDVLVRESAMTAIEEADLLLILTDVKTGVTDIDLDVARQIQRQKKTALLVVNKVDGDHQTLQQHEFYAMGLGQPYAVSAIHGTGIADLLDTVVDKLPTLPALPPVDGDLALAIIGKPNVGKSSLLNAMLGEERVLVSDTPGTTRDSIDSRINWHGHEIDIVDTAGLRKRSRVSETVDVFSSMRSLRSIERTDVCLLLLDATQPISVQDTRIAGYAHKAGKGIVVCFNKWDAIEKDTHTIKKFQENFDREFTFLTYAPILTISALKMQRVPKVFEVAWRIGESRAKTISTSKINKVLAMAFQRNPPHHYGGGNGQVKYGLQVGVKPPRFAVYVNNPKFFDRNYIRFLNNSLRKAFDYPGTVMRVELRPSTGRRMTTEPR